MKYTVKKPVPETTVLELVEEDEGVVLRDVTHEWAILKIYSDGTFKRITSIGEDSGLKLDGDGRIVERGT